MSVQSLTLLNKVMRKSEVTSPYTSFTPQQVLEAISTLRSLRLTYLAVELDDFALESLRGK